MISNYILNDMKDVALHHIKNIYHMAKIHHGNPKFLMYKLVNNMNIINLFKGHPDYNGILNIVALNTNMVTHLKNKKLTLSQNEKTNYFSVISHRNLTYIQDKDIINEFYNSPSSHDKYSLMIHLFNRVSVSNHYTNKETIIFKPISYKSIGIVINRFIHVLRQYTSCNNTISSKGYYDNFFDKHIEQLTISYTRTFIKLLKESLLSDSISVHKALIALFRGYLYKIFKHQSDFSNRISKYVNKFIVEKPYRKINQYSYKVCCPINNLLTGNHHMSKYGLPDSELKQCHENNRNLKRFKKHGYNFVTIVVNKKNPYKCSIRPVSRRDMCEIFACIKRNLKKMENN